MTTTQNSTPRPIKRIQTHYSNGAAPNTSVTKRTSSRLSAQHEAASSSTIYDATTNKNHNNNNNNNNDDLESILLAIKLQQEDEAQQSLEQKKHAEFVSAAHANPSLYNHTPTHKYNTEIVVEVEEPDDVVTEDAAVHHQALTLASTSVEISEGIQQNALVENMHAVIPQTSLELDDLKDYRTFVDAYAGYNIRHAFRSECQVPTFSDPNINHVFDSIDLQFTASGTFSQLWIQNAGTHQLKLDDKTLKQYQSYGSAAYSILFSVVGCSKDIAVGARSALGVIGGILYSIEVSKCKATSADISKLLQPFHGDPKIANTFAYLVTRLFMHEMQDKKIRTQILGEYRSFATKGLKAAQKSIFNLKDTFRAKKTLSLLAGEPSDDDGDEIKEAGTLLAQAIILAMLTKAGNTLRTDRKSIVQRYHEYTFNFNKQPNDMELSQTAMLMALTDIKREIDAKILV
jgi:hypothetical protein